MSEQLDTEDWRDFNKEWQEHKANKRSNNTSLVYKFCVAYGVNCEAKTPYHFRLTREHYNTVDVFPTSSKVHAIGVGNAKGYKKVDLIPWLIKHFS